MTAMRLVKQHAGGGIMTAMQLIQKHVGSCKTVMRLIRKQLAATAGCWLLACKCHSQHGCTPPTSKPTGHRELSLALNVTLGCQWGDCMTVKDSFIVTRSHATQR